MNNSSNEDIYEFNITITNRKYYNSESCWGTFVGYTNDDIPHLTKQSVSSNPFDPLSKKEPRMFCNIVGKMQDLQEYCEYKVKATLSYNQTYGYQYNPISVYSIIPMDYDKQFSFLQTLLKYSITKDLLDKYPTIVNDVVTGKINDIDYDSIKGLGKITWLKVKEKILNNYLISDILILLSPLGITYTMINKLLKHEPNPYLLKEKLNDNPYVLTNIKGLGFKKVDELALKLKPDIINSTHRLIAFTKFYFESLGENEGHTWVKLNVFKNEISNNVPECIDKVDWLLSNDKFLYYKDNKVGLKKYYDIEHNILDIIKKRINKPSNIIFSEEIVAKAIDKAEKEQGFKYSEEQKNLIKNVLKSNINIITGKAGVGKSSVMRAIINAYQLLNCGISASALSAMAAQRIIDSTNYDASTIHRTLEYNGYSFEINEKNQLNCDLAFMDEASMVNASLFLKWLISIKDNTNIIISGDYKQLPPIGYGNIFYDLICLFKNKIVHELTIPMRQAVLSGILLDANKIRDNINPLSKPENKIVHGKLKDMFYMFRNNRESLFKIAIKTYLKSVETDGIDNIIICVPRKKDTQNSSYIINNKIQDLLLKDETQYISSYIQDFKLGAKVVQTLNDYENNVFNGEIGYINSIYTKNNQKYCTIRYKNKEIVYSSKKLMEVELAYALTTHKLQGSGINTVICIIDQTHYKLLDSCMLYTMLTRAKKRCLLLSEPQSFIKCIKTNHNSINTFLSIEKINQ